MNLLNIAQKYVSKGLNIIPAKGKVPAINWLEFQKRKITSKELESIWFQDANLALITGQISDGIVVIDADSFDAVLELKRKGLPKTPVVKTKRGFHYYFKSPKEIKSGKLKSIPNVDVKAEGSVVIMPPSVHPDGGNYTWYKNQSILNKETATLPEWIIEEMALENNNYYDFIHNIYLGVNEGERNISLAKLVGVWFKVGLSYQEVLNFALKWNQLNSPALPEKEVITTVKSIFKREKKLRDSAEDVAKIIADNIKENHNLVDLITKIAKNENVLKRVRLIDIINILKTKEENQNV